jgi:hypothetical protein
VKPLPVRALAFWLALSNPTNQETFILPIHAAPEPEAVEVPETVVLTKTKRKELTAKAWGALEYACGMAWELDGMLDRAETFTTEGERKHRGTDSPQPPPHGLSCCERL